MSRHSRTQGAKARAPLEVFEVENQTKGLIKKASTGDREALLRLRAIVPKFRAMLKTCGASLTPEHSRDLKIIGKGLAKHFPKEWKARQ